MALVSIVALSSAEAQLFKPEAALSSARKISTDLFTKGPGVSG